MRAGSAEPDSNYAEHALRGAAQHQGHHQSHHRAQAPTQPPVIVARSQTRPPIDVSAHDLQQQVARARSGLSKLGVGPGDRVAAFMPNIPETVVLMLATASLGAVFSSCAPEFGVKAVTDRFGQIEPSVLVAVDGYRYGDRAVDRLGELQAIRTRLPGLTATVILRYLGDETPPGTVSWEDFMSDPGSLEFEQVEFDHPLYVLYSSGTTGLPKPIVHSHGGILLEHCKALGLQSNLGDEDRFFWFSTTGWMMWNYLLSGLVVGSSLVLFDGDPGFPDLLALWRLARRHEDHLVRDERAVLDGVQEGWPEAGGGARPRQSCRRRIHRRAAGG